MYEIIEDENGMSTAGIAEILLSKQRNGPTGKVKLRFAREYTRFDDLTTREPPPEMSVG
jgi:replicative DNA helicase